VCSYIVLVEFDLISPTSGEEEETEEDILSDEESAEDQQLQDAVDFEKLRETLQQVLVQGKYSRC